MCQERFILLLIQMHFPKSQALMFELSTFAPFQI